MSELKDERSAAGPRRRDLLQWAARGFLSLWAVATGWVTLSYLRPPRSRGGLAESVLHAGSLADLAIGQARLLRHGREPVWVVRLDEERLVALAGVCTHLHCVLDFDPDARRLACPCHDGAFDLNGNVTHGPPPGPLARHRVEVRLGEIYVHV